MLQAGGGLGEGASIKTNALRSWERRRETRSLGSPFANKTHAHSNMLWKDATYWDEMHFFKSFNYLKSSLSDRGSQNGNVC